ncbi:MAG: hypothetical protein Q8R37_05150 [Nanoarchaeota archaeon]|nr:hypothetical protein [Nanoarchaeota archaeon]
MLHTISQELQQFIRTFSNDDSLVFNNTIIPITKNNFFPIHKQESDKTITFIDGGQAEIISAGNFCLSFIRVAAVTFKNNHKRDYQKNEFYLLTRAEWKENEIFYNSTIYPLQEKLFSEADLCLSSRDETIKIGQERAAISKIASVARRFAELAIAQKINSDYIILDGTLDATFRNEEKYLQRVGKNVSAIAKSSSLFTTLGNAPVVLLQKMSPAGCWNYMVNPSTSFVKLHPQAKHVFRCDGNRDILPYLINNSSDPLFLGYPYGLLCVDRIARVSNDEKRSLAAAFMLRAENKEILDYCTTTNAHDILDRIG